MRVSRESVLSALHAVSPGLETNESIEQSSCVVFLNDGRLMTFNEEICASLRSPIQIVGAINAKKLTTLLTKLTDDLVEITQGDGVLRVLCKSLKKSEVKMEAQITLPVEHVDVPEVWSELSPDFMDAVATVHSCASKDTSTDFTLTCVHIHPKYLEATDRLQFCRFTVDTDLPEETLVRADTLKRVVGSGAKEISLTKSWLHFRNPAGLILSVRRFVENYRDCDQFCVAPETYPLVLPGGLSETLKRTDIFTADDPRSNYVTLDLKPGLMLVIGEGSAGNHKEKLKVSYEGPAKSFRMSPKLLLEIMKRGTVCGIGEDRVYVDGGKFKYISSTQEPIPAKKRNQQSSSGRDEVPFNGDEVPF